MSKQNDQKYTKRQRQIIEAVLKLITEQGLAGVSISKIAREISLSEAALYRHFPNRREMIIAAFDTVTDRICSFFIEAENYSAVERLHLAAFTHNKEILEGDASFIVPLYQFFSAPPSDNLDQHLRENYACILSAIRKCVMDGINENSIRRDIDIDMVVLQIMAHGLLFDVAYLTKDKDFFATGEAQKMVDYFLSTISVK